MAERQRRSLLPQKISEIQSGSSHASAAKRSIVVPGTRREISSLENLGSASGGKNVQQPSSNIARPVSLRKSEPREEKAQSADRRVPIARRKVSNSRLSYLATRRAPNPRATGTENLNASRAKTGQQTEEASDADRQILGIAIHEPPLNSFQIPGLKILFAPHRLKQIMHLTQRKASRASAYSLLAQPSDKETDTEKASAETASLQAELARLHLLHRSSADIQNAWNRSAKTRLRLQFDRVSKQNENTKELDIYRQTLRNYPALLDWSQDYSNTELAEKLDSLSHSIVVMSDFASSDSRYNHVIKTFDAWLECTTRIRKSRSTAKDNAQDGIEFIEALGDGWRSEVASLEKELMSMSLDLGRLGEPQESSNLAYVISLLKSASASKLEELQMVRDIETAVMVSEVEWIRKEAMKVALAFQCGNSDQNASWHYL
ncbi:hypothetical protein G7Y79_00001g001380 [Physcia stellaris]|nr:hypothetical protein G7Y79_00001g001380 [Physcia stellaris]